MSDKMRHRYGDTNPVVAAVDSATVIEIGDLLWHDDYDAKPASMLPQSPDQHRLATGEVVVPPSTVDMQQRFADGFLGVAMERSRDGDTAPVRVAATGVFEFDLTHAIAPFHLGEFIGVYAHENDNSLSNQQVAKVSSSRYAIGRVAKREASAAVSVLVDVRSTVMTRDVAGSSREGV